MSASQNMIYLQIIFAGLSTIPCFLLNGKIRKKEKKKTMIKTLALKNTKYLKTKTSKKTKKMKRKRNSREKRSREKRKHISHIHVMDSRTYLNLPT